MEVHDRIIWSADVPDEGTLMELLGLMPELRIVKIDRSFNEGTDLGILDVLADMEIKVFDDAKIVEIPSKVVAVAKKHLAHRPWMLNCMAGIESSDVLLHEDPEKIEALKRFADACHEAGTKPCAVTVLTSKSAKVVAREFNGRTSMEQVLYYLDIMLDCGFTDAVCSPEELPAIRAESRFDILDLNTPGIVMAGADAGDQARTNTPGGAILARTTRNVIGRALTKGNPAANYEVIATEMKAALASLAA